MTGVGRSPALMRLDRAAAGWRTSIIDARTAGVGRGAAVTPGDGPVLNPKWRYCLARSWMRPCHPILAAARL